MERPSDKPTSSERMAVAVLATGAGLLADMALFVGLFNSAPIGLAWAVPALLLAGLCWHGSPRTRGLQLGVMASALAVPAVWLVWFLIAFEPRFM